MKNTIWLTLAIIIIFLSASCEKETFYFDNSNALVAFENSEASITENEQIIKIPVTLVATAGSAVTVEFDFADTLNSELNLATEGKDFELINSSKTLTFEKGVGIDTITIKTIDNDLADGNKNVWIVIKGNSAGYNIGYAEGANSAKLLSIIDDEHPLSSFVGSYYSECTPIWWGAYWWNSVVNVDPDDPNGLLISAFGWSKQPYGDFVVKATVDIDAETITIAAGPTQIAEAYGDGYYHAFCVGDPATMGPDGSNNYGKPLEVPLVGTYTTNTGGKHVFAFQNWGVKWMKPDGTYNGNWWWEFVSSSTMTQE
jgi:hypothetical protein